MADGDGERDLDKEMIELLNELRVALPGVQVLFGFLLILPFSNGWKDVSSVQRDVYFVSLLCTAVASALLIAPSAQHRIRWRAHDKEYLLRCAWGSMKTPFLNMTAARMYLERAMALDAADWEVWANLAAVSLFEGRVEDGRRELEKAVALRGQPIDSTDRSRVPCLHEALEHLPAPVEGVR